MTTSDRPRSEASNLSDDESYEDILMDDDELVKSRRRSSAVSRRSSVAIEDKQVDQILIDGRESHTSDLAALSRYLARMQDYHRHSSDTPYNKQFWDYIYAMLEEHGQPLGFGPDDDPTAIVAKGPEDAMAFLCKKFVLDPLSPINPSVIAEAANVTLDIALTELLYANKIGLVSMKFAPECTRCGGAVCAASRLCFFADSSKPIHCDGCSYGNFITQLDQISVVFFLHPSVLYLLFDGFGCNPSKESQAATIMMAPVPATTTGSGFRYSVGCGDKPMMPEPLGKGRYRMHCLIAGTENYLDILDDAPEDEDEAHILPINISDIKVKGHDHERPSIEVPHGRIHFDVTPDTQSLFALWVQHNVSDETVFSLPKIERAPYTSAARILHHPAYDRHFSEGARDMLKVATSLEIQNVVLVFTDIVGSTDMYNTLGNWEALDIVKKHFEVLFCAFSRWGRVVKTIGDAVMAAFATGSAAIEAVAEAMIEVGQECKRSDGKPFKIRVGMHAGPAVVVPLNGINDYFGSTVNHAARIESKADPEECLISESLLELDQEAVEKLEEIIGENEYEAIDSQQLEMRGVNGTMGVRGFKISDAGIDEDGNL
mmetsp:Transcript_15703/g.24425  ORF Transcript_15703/g.24425 Transcript_15703/m.24425 type:complete len:601 (+) Transcript_15703:59-1861(+)